MELAIAFLKAFLKDPRRIGAIAPSGMALGDAMVKVVLADNPGCVVELGAGTGSITRALMGIRSQLDDLIVIEKSPGLVKLLADLYPTLTIVTGCASLVSKLDFPGRRPLTIVSSLPLRSLPRDELTAITNAIGTLSDRNAGFRFIQYSYFGRVPFVSDISRLTWEKMHTVLANIPPATVWLLRDTSVDAPLPRMSSLRETPA